MSYWYCPKCGGIPGVTACCSSNPAPAAIPQPAPPSAQVIQLDDHRPHLTFTTHANQVHVFPVSFFVDAARGKQPIDNLGEHRDAILRVVLGEWLSMLGVATAEQLLTKDAEPCPDES